MNNLKPMSVVDARYAVHYDGTNSAAIAESIPDFTVTAETPEQLTFTSANQSWNVARGGYIAYAGGSVGSVYQNKDDFGDALTHVSTGDHVHDLVLTTGGAKPLPAETA